MSTVSPVYNFCSAETGTCELSSPRSVAYAAVDKTGSIFYRNLSGTVNCNDNTFGDPSPGHAKACYAASLPTDFASGQIFDTNGNPTGEWKNCGTENSGTCNPLQANPVDIIYGAAGHYVYANALAAPCGNNIFGDPAPGHVKSCWWRPSTSVGPNPAPVGPTPPAPIPITPVGPPVPCTNVPSTPSTGGACNNVINGFNYYIRSCANIIIIIIIIIIVFIIMALLMRKTSQ